jgi:serine/threonine protein kinase
MSQRKIGKYELRDIIGRGSMGTVYLAYDSFAQKNVAVKVADAKASDDADAELFRKMFFNEAHAAGLLKHPNIVEVYDAIFDDNNYYLVMEYIQGKQTLREYCNTDKLLSVDRILEIVFKCATALDYAHRKGVVHRDIKPSNILLSEKGDIKIVDFGIAHVVNAETTQITGVAGTPRYMSPEQIKDEKITSQTDLYSLGVVMYELLTGKAPFTGDTITKIMYKVVNEVPVPVRKFRRDVPEVVDRVLQRVMQKNPAKRYKTGLDFAADLSIGYERLKLPNRDLPEERRIDLAKSLKFFEDFSDKEILEFVRASDWQKFAPGEYIIEEGTEDFSVYIIAGGEVMVEKKGKLLEVLKKGECFGEIAYLIRSKRTASIKAGTEVCLIRVNDSLLDRASQSCQLRFSKVFLGSLAARLVKVSTKLSEVAD